MATIYELASKGALTKKDLEGQQEINYVDQKQHLTPLGVAAWYGHKNQVKLLLENGANPDGVEGARPPLWVATTKTKQNSGAVIQLLLKHGANPNQQSAPVENTTPLLGAMKTYKSAAIISALVDAQASPQIQNDRKESAESVAEKRKDRDRLQALLPREKRQTSRLPTLLALSGLMLGVVAWANKYKNWKAPVAAGVGLAAANAIKNRFGMNGHFIYGYFPQRLQEPTAAEKFKKDVRQYINDSHLDRFFPHGDKFLEKVVERAVELDEKPDNKLNTHDLCRLALYQPYLYCDDSGSMKTGDRRAHQNELVQRITSITTRLVPDETGIELRFINHETSSQMSKPDLETINSIINELPLNGSTEIGTNLKEKILDKAVDAAIENKEFNRPLLVSIITDGHPSGPPGSLENDETLKNAILDCGRTLEKNEYCPKVVRFQISQIGSDEKAGDFLRSLKSDPRLDDVLYCTSEKLDDEFARNRENETRLEQWLLQLLMSPIIDADAF